MKPEAQRIAIAEACGWTNIHTCTCGSKQRGTSPDGGHEGHIPNYLSDLNTALSLVDLLSERQWGLKLSKVGLIWVCEIVGLKAGEYAYVTHEKPAPAICEAFLRTLGLWTT